jgi:hypothetical protein
MNLWRRFLDLMPKQPLVVVTILGGTHPIYNVQHQDGGTQEVTSDVQYATGSNLKVFVQEGRIVGLAPTGLSEHTIDLV